MILSEFRRLVIFMVVFLVSLVALTRWGPDKLRCYLSLLVAPQDTESICAQAYPDTWRKGPKT